MEEIYQQLLDHKKYLDKQKYDYWIRGYINFIKRLKSMNFNPVKGENHHIIPKSWGGTDSKDNLIRLTFQQHIIAHVYLMRTTDPKMIRAFNKIKTGNDKNHRDVNINSWLIQEISLQKYYINRSQGRQVVNLETDTVYDSIRDACKINKINLSYFRFCMKYCNPINGQYWQYKDQITGTTQQEIEKIKQKRHILLQDSHNRLLISREEARINRSFSVINVNTKQKFICANDAAKAYNVSESSLKDAIERKAKSANCYWIYEKDVNGRSLDDILKEYSHNVPNKFIMKIINIQTQQIFNGLAEAIKFYNVRGNSIISSIELCGTCKGYNFAYYDIYKLYDDYLSYFKANKQVIQSVIKQYRQDMSSIICIETKQIYKSKTQAMKETGIIKNCIDRSILLGVATHNTHWMFYRDYLKQYCNNPYNQ